MQPTETEQRQPYKARLKKRVVDWLYSPDRRLLGVQVNGIYRPPPLR